MGAILAGLLVFALFLGPIIARLVLDRRLDRANIVAADVRAAVRRRLGGDSMVSVQVESAGLWSPGRVVLRAPGGYQDLVEKVWSVVALRVPAGYELVVRAPSAARPLAASSPKPLSRAA
jgi:hypothetical protein